MSDGDKRRDGIASKKGSLVLISHYDKDVGVSGDSDEEEEKEEEEDDDEGEDANDGEPNAEEEEDGEEAIGRGDVHSVGKNGI